MFSIEQGRWVLAQLFDFSLNYGAKNHFDTCLPE
jgi:hypothetical protein